MDVVIEKIMVSRSCYARKNRVSPCNHVLRLLIICEMVVVVVELVGMRVSEGLLRKTLLTLATSSSFLPYVSLTYPIPLSYFSSRRHVVTQHVVLIIVA